MKKLAFALLLVLSSTLNLTSPASAALEPITGNHVFFNVSNENSVKFNWDAAKYGDATANNNQYYILADGGGLNQLHITTDANNTFGQATTVNTTTSSSSGSFYISTTGGRGFNDDIILLASVKGPISNDFSLHITSSGYTWEVSPVTNILPTIYSHGTGISETFNKDDFLYGPQTVKPGPIREGTLPLYYGQDFNDASTAEYLMFIDLYVGNLSSSVISGLTDGGAVKVDYSFTGMASVAAFNAYAWAAPGKDPQGVNWTTRTNGTVNYSGYAINYTGAPVPIPPAVFLFGSGLSGLFFIRRRRLKV
ncbi:MAG: hypothetical protein VB050_00865 [Geobacteraceae bacterium]|nr:hypothetical protein [Geobacteraceae bacterium]